MKVQQIGYVYEANEHNNNREFTEGQTIEIITLKNENWGQSREGLSVGSRRMGLEKIFSITQNEWKAEILKNFFLFWKNVENPSQF